MIIITLLLLITSTKSISRIDYVFLPESSDFDMLSIDSAITELDSIEKQASKPTNLQTFGITVIRNRQMIFLMVG